MTAHAADVSGGGPAGALGWSEQVAPFQTPVVGRSVWQLANTLVPYAALWYLMSRSLAVSYWLTLPLAILAGGMLVRAFIIFHDCGHGSFFRSRTARDLVGFVTGVLTFTPYHHWRWQHSIHHASAGNLDRRGTGDVWTMTVQEYREAPRGRRLTYRLTRNPVVLFLLAPLYLFLVRQRFASPLASPRERRSVHATNLGVLAVAGVMSWLIGVKAYLLIQLTVLGVAGSAGVWLFYVQHQFDGVYWARHGDWDYTEVALRGSSFYRLPRILQWFTGNIGFHHIHHLRPGIPNYHLEKCHKAVALFQTVKAVTLLSSLKSLTFRLWDEQSQRLVGYGPAATVRSQPQPASRG